MRGYHPPELVVRSVARWHQALSRAEADCVAVRSVDAERSKGDASRGVASHIMVVRLIGSRPTDRPPTVHDSTSPRSSGDKVARMRRMEMLLDDLQDRAKPRVAPLETALGWKLH